MTYQERLPGFDKADLAAQLGLSTSEYDELDNKRKALGVTSVEYMVSFNKAAKEKGVSLEEYVRKLRHDQHAVIGSDGLTGRTFYSSSVPGLSLSGLQTESAWRELSPAEQKAHQNADGY